MPRSARRLVALLVVLAAGPAAQAQITVTPRGDAAVLDVAAWNLEFFGEPTQGPSDALQAERVQAVLERAQMDIWALEEVVSTTGWNTLLANIADDGYAGFLGPSVNSDPVFNQRLAFVYNTSVVQPIGTPVTVVPGTNFGGRAPLGLRANVTLGGVTREMLFIAIHAKASSDVASYDKRVAGAAQLKAYLDGIVAQGLTVVVMGDFNDELTTRSPAGGRRPTRPSSRTRTTVFATQRLNDQNVGTYCGSSSTCNTRLDHRPHPARRRRAPGLRRRLGRPLQRAAHRHHPVHAPRRRTTCRSWRASPCCAVAGEAGPDDGRLALAPAAPNPFRTSTTLRFTLAEGGDVAIDVIDVLGRTVAHVGGAYGAGEHRVALDGTGLAAGVYRVRLRAAGTERVQTVVRAR